jgi:hypothetical protein
MVGRRDIERMLDRITEGTRPDGVISEGADKGRPVWFDRERNIVIVDKRYKPYTDKIIDRIQKEFA